MPVEPGRSRIRGQLGSVLLCIALVLIRLLSAGAAAQEGASPVMIRLENPAGQPGLERLDTRTHIYQYGDERTWIQLSFD